MADDQTVSPSDDGIQTRMADESTHPQDNLRDSIWSAWSGKISDEPVHFTVSCAGQTISWSSTDEETADRLYILGNGSLRVTRGRESPVLAILRFGPRDFRRESDHRSDGGA